MFTEDANSGRSTALNHICCGAGDSSVLSMVTIGAVINTAGRALNNPAVLALEGDKILLKMQKLEQMC